MASAGEGQETLGRDPEQSATRCNVMITEQRGQCQPSDRRKIYGCVKSHSFGTATTATNCHTPIQRSVFRIFATVLEIGTPLGACVGRFLRAQPIPSSLLPYVCDDHSLRARIVGRYLLHSARISAGAAARSARPATNSIAMKSAPSGCEIS